MTTIPTTPTSATSTRWIDRHMPAWAVGAGFSLLSPAYIGGAANSFLGFDGGLAFRLGLVLLAALIGFGVLFLRGSENVRRSLIAVNVAALVCSILWFTTGAVSAAVLVTPAVAIAALLRPTSRQRSASAR